MPMTTTIAPAAQVAGYKRRVFQFLLLFRWVSLLLPLVSHPRSAWACLSGALRRGAQAGDSAVGA